MQAKESDFKCNKSCWRILRSGMPWSFYVCKRTYWLHGSVEMVMEGCKQEDDVIGLPCGDRITVELGHIILQ